MYKFTNGIVVFDEKTRDSYIKAGYRLVKEKIKEVPKEELNENDSNDTTIEEEHTKRNTKVTKDRK